MADTALGKLRWRCRRGTRELDALLLNWLEQRYADAGVAERQAFEQLLDLQDPALMQLITDPGNVYPGADTRPANGPSKGIRDSAPTETQASILQQIRHGLGT